MPSHLGVHMVQATEFVEQLDSYQERRKHPQKELHMEQELQQPLWSKLIDFLRNNSKVFNESSRHGEDQFQDLLPQPQH